MSYKVIVKNLRANTKRQYNPVCHHTVVMSIYMLVYCSKFQCMYMVIY